MRLGELLVSQNVITPDQLEEGLRTQAFYGARLGTNLVELGLLDLETLTNALAMQLGLAGAQKEHFEAIKPGAIQLLPKKFAEKHCAIPLGLAKGSERQLVVAFREPRDIAGVDEVAFATGKRVTAAVAPELRMYYYLEKYYAVHRKSRYLRLQANTAGTDAVRRPIPGSAVDAFAPPPTGSIPPATRRATPPAAPVFGADVPDGDISIGAVLGDVQVPASGPVAARPAPLSSPPPAVVTATLDPAAAAARINAAQNRDQIGDALVGYLRGPFGCGLVLIAKDDMALGWKGFAPGIDQTVIETIALPLGSASMVSRAFETHGPFRGPPPSAGAALQGRLWKLLKVAQPPAEVMVVPIVLRERVVNLVYVHAQDGGALPENATTALLTLVHAAANGYTRLIQRTKQKS